MLSFKFLLGAAAFFAVASAAPSLPAQGIAVRGAPATPALANTNVAPAVDLDRRCATGGCPGGSEPTSIAAIVADVDAQLGPIVADIKAAIAVSAGVTAKVDIKVILALLVKIQVLLAACLANIKVCISVHGVLSLTGAVLSAVQLCALVGGLINTVLQVLVVVIRGCGGIHLDLQLCISAIIALCADILSVCIVALPSVKVLLAVLLKTVCITLGTLGAQIAVLTECLSL
ncbi:hypothetical protein D9611_007821 [Ephemerocybe angulata]|uniref:Transmembrane protein n=1 Tax=Ephemerocybe angulata TaxID=980116 RepID=A0A8H5CGD2_9AGAR|nr:hypothetical protein D9611_007821 [Tulosesus angulatus]